MSERACEDVRRLLPDLSRGTLPSDEARALEAHLASCASCARELSEERVLSELLSTRLPQRAAPAHLRQALMDQVAQAITADKPVQAPVRARSRNDAAVPARRTVIASLFSLSLAAAVALGFFWHGAETSSPLVREALNDHLRVLYAQNPIEVPNGGLHQVKPWFTGRVEFAPDITFVGDEEFPMLGGAVGYFMDRKAASFVFKRRLHTISLFVFRGEGLKWPSGSTRHIGDTRVQLTNVDGFNVLLWQDHGLGHALVSDVSSEELWHLTEKLLH